MSHPFVRERPIEKQKIMNTTHSNDYSAVDSQSLESIAGGMRVHDSNGGSEHKVSLVLQDKRMQASNASCLTCMTLGF